jgi:transposase
MDQGTTYVALDDSKRKVVVAILRPGQTQPEQREMPKEPHLIRRLFQRLTREGPVAACYEAGVSGYDLHRQITAYGVSCTVIAPALTPGELAGESRPIVAMPSSSSGSFAPAS